jgi:drug/metabolite transporter (DMT)-like permease
MNSHHPYALVTIIFWSLAYVLTRITLEYFSAYTLGFLRYFVAAAVMAFFAARLRIKPPPPGDLGWFLLAGLTGVSLYMIAFNKGCETVTASESSVLIATVPAITAIMAKLIYKEEIRPYQYPAIALEFIGVVVLVEPHKTFNINQGLLWLLGAAFLLSAYNLLQRKLTKKYSPLQTAMYSIFMGEILLFAFAPGALAEMKNAPPVQLLYIAALGVFSSAVAYFSWSTALAKAKETSSVSNYMFLTPLLTTLLGYWLINENPPDSAITGGAIILAGMAVFNFGGAFKRRVA